MDPPFSVNGLTKCYPLIEAGANFASSPKRVGIDTLDPLLIATKLAFTPINVTVLPVDFVKESLKNTGSNTDMIGGVHRATSKSVTV